MNLFPLDIACRASNLSERESVIRRFMDSPRALDQGPATLSNLDRWKINKLAPKLTAQLREEAPTTEDEFASLLSLYRLWELNLGSLDTTERQRLADIHASWLPTYYKALSFFDPTEAASAEWRASEVYYGRFARVCEPFLLHIHRELETARRSTNELAGWNLLSPHLVSNFQNHLLSRFDLALAWVIEADMSVYCHHANLNKTEASYEEFITYFNSTFTDRDAYHRFYLRFPVLGRWLSQVTRWICDNGRTLFERLRNDLDEVSDTLFGDPIVRIRSLQLGKSDYHAGGQSVARVEVELEANEQAAFIYKPRCLQFEMAMQKFLQDLTKAEVLDFGIRKVISKDEYGYEQLIPADKNRVDSIVEAEKIYEELGGYLGIFHVLGGTDLHYENVLIADGHAFVCDCETMLGVRPMGREQTFGTVLDSVYKTGLLEWPQGHSPHGALEMRISGYAGGESYEMPVAVPRVNDQRMSLGVGVRHEAGVRIEPDAANRVYLQGELVSPEDFKNSIIRGFDRVHTWFQDEKVMAAHVVTELFERAPVRFVNWATEIYEQLLVASRHPKCLMDPLEVDLLFNKLREYPRKWDGDRFVAQCEVASLWNLDVPMFTAGVNSRKLVHDHRKPVSEALAATPLEDAIERIVQLSSENLAHQVQYIAASLSSREVHSPEFVASAADYARRVGHKLCSLLQDSPGGSPWKSYQVDGTELDEVDILADLYNGTAGVALFLAYLDSIAPDEQFRSAANRALSHAITHTSKDHISAFQGTCGLIYVLTHLSQLWDDELLLAQAVELTRNVMTQIEGDREFDVFNGTAGVIPVMIGLAEVTSGEGIDVAHACARHLLQNAERGKKGLSWPLARPAEGIANLTGFAHGASGIGWALIWLGCLTDKPEYIAAGREAFEYETTHFDEEQEDWYDLRTNVIAMVRGRRHFSNAWCNGAAGIGLARITTWAMLGKNDDDTTLKEAYQALAATLRNFHTLGNDSLCHGRSGNAELFLQFAKLKGESAFQVEANIQAQAQWQSLEEDQSLEVGIESARIFPGLMLGLAGFGMHFLRLAHPDHIPSPLLLDIFPAL